MSLVIKTFSRAKDAPAAVFDPHGSREHARELEWRGDDPTFVGPVADPLWLWLMAGCPCVCSSVRRAIRVALARRREAF